MLYSQVERSIVVIIVIVRLWHRLGYCFFRGGGSIGMGDFDHILVRATGSALRAILAFCVVPIRCTTLG